MQKANKNILVISQVFPFPLHDGGRMDVYYRLKALHALGYQVVLIAYYNPKFGSPDVKPLEAFCHKIYALPYLRRKLSKIFHWKPYSIGSRENISALKQVVQKLKGENITFGGIFAESHHVITVARALKEDLQIPKLFLRSHNNEPRFMLSLAQSSPLLSIKQAFFLTEACKYKFYEKVLMKSFSAEDEILHISYDECQESKMIYPHIHQQFLPAGIECSSTKPSQSQDRKNVLFAGALFSPNNLQGLKWYLEKIHKNIEKKISGYQLIIAGNTAGADRKLIQNILNLSPNIIFYDTPKDLRPIYADAQVFINPMQYGAGVKLKTLDAIINGLPVVATTIGNEGTGLVNREHIFVEDKHEEFESAVCNLLINPKIREKTILNAQSFLERHYDQKKALQKILGG